MARNAVRLELSASEVAQLNGWQSAHGTAQQVALRCRLVLAAAEGKQDVEIAVAFRVSRHTASLWRRRVHEKGIGAVWEIEKGRGRKPQLDQARRDAIIAATLGTKPAGATHWSCRDMADAQGVSKNTVNRLWQLHNLKPHLSQTFKLSRDPKFVEKLTDVVGLYLNPPEKVLVLCVDEKSQIQALDRTQPGLPMKKGRCGTMTHDYKRNGTTTLFAAMSVLDGKVVGQCQPRHRHQEFLKFLRLLDREFPGKRELHLILDNYGSKSYMPPFELGKAMDGGAVGEVVESRANGFKAGDAVVSSRGWREYFIAPPAELHSVNRGLQPLSVYLGTLGMTGMTAWAGLKLVDVKAGDVIFISGAAGAVGNVAGQLAKLRGCTVTGSAGSPEKVQFLLNECGFDHAFDYNAGPILPQLTVAAPDGIDVYFDNVGGPALVSCRS